MNRDRRSSGSEPSGFTIPEVLISLMLLGVVLSVIVPFVRRANDQTGRSETRRAALFEVSNALERLSIDPAKGPAGGAEQTLPLPDDLARRLVDPVLVVRAVAVDDPPGRRFDATLTWTEPTGGRAAAVRLSAFAFDRPGTEGGMP